VRLASALHFGPHFWRLFTVGDQLFGLNTWGAALWRFGVGFEPPDPARGQWFEFSDFAIAGRRSLLYDDYYNALWATDGTAPGTYPLQYLPGPNPLRSDSFAGETNSSSFTVASDHIFFAANSGDVGQELWALPVTALPEVCTGDCTSAPPPPDTPTPPPTVPQGTPAPASDGGGCQVQSGSATGSAALLWLPLLVAPVLTRRSAASRQGRTRSSHPLP
jgi:hypothetical protein